MSSAVTIPNSDQIAAMVTDAAKTYGVDPSLALAVAQQESGLNPSAVSSAGAVGVMQLEPTTAASLGVNPNNIQENIDGGVEYLSQLLDQFGGNTDQALAAYDAGPTAVSDAISTANASNSTDWLSLLPSETQNYVASILAAVGLGSSTSSASTATASATGASTAGNIFTSSTFSALLLLTGVTVGALLVADLLGELAD